jgi:hypothetical protein
MPAGAEGEKEVEIKMAEGRAQVQKKRLIKFLKKK